MNAELCRLHRQSVNKASTTSVMRTFEEMVVAAVATAVLQHRVRSRAVS